MSDTGSSVTMIFERYFTEHIVYNYVPEYIGDIVAVKFEFTRTTTANNRYSVIGVLYDYGSNARKATLYMMFEDSQNTMVTSTIIQHTGYYICPDQRTTAMLSSGNLLIYSWATNFRNYNDGYRNQNNPVHFYVQEISLNTATGNL